MKRSPSLLKYVGVLFFLRKNWKEVVNWAWLPYDVILGRFLFDGPFVTDALDLRPKQERKDDRK